MLRYVKIICVKSYLKCSMYFQCILIMNKGSTGPDSVEIWKAPKVLNILLESFELLFFSAEMFGGRLASGD